MESRLLLLGGGFVGLWMAAWGLRRRTTGFFRVMLALGLAMVVLSMVVWWIHGAVP